MESQWLYAKQFTLILCALSLKRMKYKDKRNFHFSLFKEWNPHRSILKDVMDEGHFPN